jgi:polysaccharide biosynthesis protein PslJ
LFGIGFGQSPDSDVTAGVSSIYLLVGEQMGLLGILVYALTLATILVGGIRGLRAAAASNPVRQGLVGALLATFAAMLVAGAFDHYFANQDFPHAVALFWLMAGLLVAAGRREPAPTRVSRQRSGRVL